VGLLHAQRRRLLDEQGYAALRRGDLGISMRKRWDEDADGVELLAVEEGVVIRVPARDAVLVTSCGEVLRTRIAECDQVDLRECRENRQMADFGHLPDTDDADGELGHGRASARDG